MLSRNIRAVPEKPKSVFRYPVPDEITLREWLRQMVSVRYSWIIGSAVCLIFFSFAAGAIIAGEWIAKNVR